MGPAVAEPFNRAANPAAGMAFTIAGTLVTASGAVLALRLHWSDLGLFFDRG